MIARIKDKKTGKFIQKSSQKRKVRSIRLTDNTYEYLTQKAKENNQTIADFIEQIAEDKILDSKNISENLNNLLNKSRELLYDESLVRAKDRSPVKKILSNLFGIDKKFYDQPK